MTEKDETQQSALHVMKGVASSHDGLKKDRSEKIREKKQPFQSMKFLKE